MGIASKILIGVVVFLVFAGAFKLDSWEQEREYTEQREISIAIGSYKNNKVLEYTLNNGIEVYRVTWIENGELKQALVAYNRYGEKARLINDTTHK